MTMLLLLILELPLKLTEFVMSFDAVDADDPPPFLELCLMFSSSLSSRTFMLFYYVWVCCCGLLIIFWEVFCFDTLAVTCLKDDWGLLELYLIVKPFDITSLSTVDYPAIGSFEVLYWTEWYLFCILSSWEF
jgi:hypothetical protein